MTKIIEHIWKWGDFDVTWQEVGVSSDSPISIVLIHGFGASKEHWRNNQGVLGAIAPCYAVDLIGFGGSSQPPAKFKGEQKNAKTFFYNFDNWGKQISEFSQLIIKKPVILIGNSIGGVIALRAAKLLKDNCKGVILINCAQRTMDDKRLFEQPKLMQIIRPLLKKLTGQRWISKNLFNNFASPFFIEKTLKQAYPSGANINNELISILYKPTQRVEASEAFHGFINLFDDHLAPELMKDLDVPIDLIWGENDPWESISEAKNWFSSIPIVRSLEVIHGAGHCPHDEVPEKVNKALLKIIQQAT